MKDLSARKKKADSGRSISTPGYRTNEEKSGSAKSGSEKRKSEPSAEYRRKWARKSKQESDANEKSRRRGRNGKPNSRSWPGFLWTRQFKLPRVNIPGR